MIEIFLGLLPQQRLEKSGRLFASARHLSEIAVMRRDPRLAGLDLKSEVFRLMYRSGLSEQFLVEVERRAPRNGEEHRAQNTAETSLRCTV